MLGWIVVGVLATLVIFGSTIALPIVLVSSNPNPPPVRFGQPVPPIARAGAIQELPTLPPAASTTSNALSLGLTLEGSSTQYSPPQTTAPITGNLPGVLQDYQSVVCVNKVAGIWLTPSAAFLAPNSPAMPGDMVRRIGLSEDGKMARITFRDIFPQAFWMRNEDLSLSCDGISTNPTAAGAVAHLFGSLAPQVPANFLPESQGILRPTKRGSLAMKLHNLRHQLIRCGEDAACSERVHKSILALMGQMSVQRKRRLRKMKHDEQAEEDRARWLDQEDRRRNRREAREERKREEREEREARRLRRQAAAPVCDAACQEQRVAQRRARRAALAERRRVRRIQRKIRHVRLRLRRLHVALAACGTNAACEKRIDQRIVAMIERFRLLSVSMCSASDSACSQRAGRVAEQLRNELRLEERSLHGVAATLLAEQRAVEQERLDAARRAEEERRQRVERERAEAAEAARSAAVAAELQQQQANAQRLEAVRLAAQQQEAAANAERLAAIQRTEEQEALQHLQQDFLTKQGAAMALATQQVAPEVALQTVEQRIAEQHLAQQQVIQANEQQAHQEEQQAAKAIQQTEQQQQL